MNISLEPGRYVVAVSGGVDSVVLLHLLRTLPDIQLTVAHFDHGIRPESGEDERFVRQLAAKYGLPYVYHRGELGPRASEAAARQARYAFLRRARLASGAQAVVTAHHQDDVLETAILNLARGTGRRGLTSLKPTDVIKRPLLHVPKAQLVRYARDNQLVWREDSTNADIKYRRNHVRHTVLPKFSNEDRRRLHDLIVTLRQLNEQIDDALDEALRDMSDEQGRLQRSRFIMLPHAVAREVMAAWLRQHAVADIDRKMVERLVHGAKTFTAGKRISATMDWSLVIVRAGGKDFLALKPNER